MIDLGKKNLLGVLLDAVDYESAAARILSAGRRRVPLSVTALAVHGVMLGVQDPAFRYRLNHLDLVLPDGQPVRWGLNILHQASLPDRVYGPALTLQVCEKAAEESLSIYLYGSRVEVLKALSTNLQRKFPGLIIAGQSPSLFRPASSVEKEAIIGRILESGSAITLVGLGCPRQEVWVYEITPHIHQPALAVGAAFEFHAGLRPQAPRWMQNAGLEWLFRLSKEPGRLWKRYLFLNPWYLALLSLQELGLVCFNPQDAVAPKDHMIYA